MLENRKKIIISADDFGKSKLANQRILELAKLNKINRISVMPDGAFSSEEIADILRSGAKIDIHLDLFDKNKTKVRSVFLRLVDFAFNFLSSRGRKENVEKEWERQIEKIKEFLGRYPDGINSHQHIHFFPPYFKVVLKLAKKYKIPYLRYGKSLTAEKFSAICWILKILRIFNNKLFALSDLKTSQYLVSFDWLKNPEKFLNNLDGVELVCHPERDDEFDIIKNL